MSNTSRTPSPGSFPADLLDVGIDHNFDLLDDLWEETVIAGGTAGSGDDFDRAAEPSSTNDTNSAFPHTQMDTSMTLDDETEAAKVRRSSRRRRPSSAAAAAADASSTTAHPTSAASLGGRRRRPPPPAPTTTTTTTTNTTTSSPSTMAAAHNDDPQSWQQQTSAPLQTGFGLGSGVPLFRSSSSQPDASLSFTHSLLGSSGAPQSTGLVGRLLHNTQTHMPMASGSTAFGVGTGGSGGVGAGGSFGLGAPLISSSTTTTTTSTRPAAASAAASSTLSGSYPRQQPLFHHGLSRDGSASGSLYGSTTSLYDSNDHLDSFSGPLHPDISYNDDDDNDNNGNDDPSSASASNTPHHDQTKKSLTPYRRKLLKRDTHNQIERRRRDAINDRITELAALVPDDFSRDKQSKGQVLKTCVEYTQHLQAQNQQYRDEYERILRVNMLLEQRQRDFQNRISQLEQTIQELEHHIATLVLNEHRPNTANLAAPTTPSAAASDAATADPGNCSESDSSHVHAHSPYDHHKTPPDSREPEA